MSLFTVIETDHGFTVIELKDSQTVEDAAVEYGGYVVDPGPYPTYGEACDAMLGLDDGEDEWRGVTR